MASRLNSEFNYRYQVIGETPWEKINTLKGFLEGRVRAAALEQVAKLKYQSKLSELKHLRENGGLEHIILNLEAEIIETESFIVGQIEAFELNHQEIACIEKILKELYEIAEPTRIPGYTDQQMHEANAANEFAVWVAKEIQAEILAVGHPSPAKLRNAMSNPVSWKLIQDYGLIHLPNDMKLIGGDDDPLRIGFNPVASTVRDTGSTDTQE